MKRLEKKNIPSAQEILSSPFCFRAVLPGNIHIPDIDLPAEEPAGSVTCDQGLIESIRTHGIIEPPLVIPRDGKDCIVTGHRRLAAAVAVGMTDADMLVMDIPEDTVPATILNIWFESASRGTALSELERLLLLSRVQALTGPDLEEIMPALAPVFGRDISTNFAQRLLALLEMPPSVRTALHDGRMKAGDLLTLGSHSSIDIEEAAALLLEEKMSRGSMKKVIRLVLYLADQHGSGWRSALESSDESTLPLAIRLGKACYPAFEKDRAEIARLIDETGLPAEASINPPDNLEGGAYTLNIRIRDEGRFSVILEKLSVALSAGRIRKLLDILKGK